MPADEIANSREVQKLRELAEGLAIKVQVLQKRLDSVIPEGAIRQVAVSFLGAWPMRKSATRHGIKQVAVPVEIPAGPALRPFPGHAAISLRDTGFKTIGFDLLGLTAAQTAAFVDLVAERQRKQHNFVPVFLTDCQEFHVFRKHGFVFEYLPPSEDQASTPGGYDWAARIAERKSAFKAKWGVLEFFSAAQGAEKTTA